MGAPRIAWLDVFSCLPFRTVMPVHETAAARLLRTVSLDALRGFEAAARHLSFTAAADALGLTQSAVSKQVKSLEDAFGKALFTRGPRGLALTAHGHLLHVAVRDTLARLEGALQQLVQADRQAVSVSVTPSFASLWLVPRLAAYAAQAPAVDIRVDAAEAPVSLERTGIDLAVRLSPPAAAAAGWKLLAHERLLLVAAPAIAQRLRTPIDLTRQALLVFQHTTAQHPWMSWRHWYDHLGLTQAATQPVFEFSQYEHLLKAAAEGLGVAIGRTPLVLPLLRRGQLEVVLPELQAQGLAYYLVTSADAAARPEVQAFAAWVERELAAEALG